MPLGAGGLVGVLADGDGRALVLVLVLPAEHRWPVGRYRQEVHGRDPGYIEYAGADQVNPSKTAHG